MGINNKINKKPVPKEGEVSKTEKKLQKKANRAVSEDIVRKGFIISKLDKLLNWGRAGSLWTNIFGSGCGSIEVMQAHGANYDLEQFGVLFKENISQADVLIVTGAITNRMSELLRKTYDEMQTPKWVIAFGAEANNGGRYYQSYSVVKGCDKIIPVDIYVPGSAPTAETLLYAITLLQKKIKRGE